MCIRDSYEGLQVPVTIEVDTETKEYIVIENTSEHFGGPDGMPPEMLKKKAQIDVMIVAGIGQRAIGLFKDFNIKVYTGASGTIKEVVEQFLNDKLILASDKDGCKH